MSGLNRGGLALTEDGKRHRTRREWQAVEPSTLRILKALDAIDPHEESSMFRSISGNVGNKEGKMSGSSIQVASIVSCPLNRLKTISKGYMGR